MHPMAEFDLGDLLGGFQGGGAVADILGDDMLKNSPDPIKQGASDKDSVNTSSA